MQKQRLIEEYKETELGLLPKEWKLVKLEDVAKISSGGSAPQGKNYFNGKNPFIRVQHIDNREYIIQKYDFITDKAVEDYKLKIYPKRTIVFPKSGASVYLEKRAVLPIDAYIVSHLCAVLSDKDGVLQDFLFYVLRNVKFAKEKTDGYPTLNLSEVKKVKVPLPPLSEQRNIAFVLSTIQEAKEKTDAVVFALRETKKSLMKHLFTYGPVPIQEAEKVELKETEIGKMPKEWDLVRLGTICEIKSGGTPSKKEKKYWDNGDVPWIKSGQCQDCIIFKAEEHITKSGLENSSAKLLRPKTTLIAMVGATVGKTGFLTFKACTNQNVAGLFPLDMTHLNEKYLFYTIQNEYQEFTKTKGFVIANLSFIKRLPIPLPKYPTQKQIALSLSIIDAHIEAEQDKANALQKLFNSMLRDLMTAKIRVKDLVVINETGT